jgi:N-acetyl-alpha-D-muramate 1-phosphate uridylyltransferase
MNVPETAMVLAAGLGMRLRPITETLPKALVPIAGKPLLDHAIDRLAAVGVKRVVVNLHHRGAMIAEHLGARRDIEIIFSKEEELLETGGGILNVLPRLGENFYVVLGDVFWLDGITPALIRLAREFDAERMDGLLLLQRTVTAVGLDGPGDFIIDPMGQMRWRGETEIAPHFFAGVQILNRGILAGAEQGKFSLRPYWTRAIEAGRLFGIVHDGEWFHVGTPHGLARVEQRLGSRFIER